MMIMILKAKFIKGHLMQFIRFELPADRHLKEMKISDVQMRHQGGKGGMKKGDGFKGLALTGGPRGIFYCNTIINI